MRVAVTGTPGVGKHVIGDKVAKELGMELIDIGEVAIAKEFGQRDERRDTFEVDTEKLKKELEKKDNCIFVSSYSEFMNVDLAIVIRCNPKVLKKRLEKRNWSKEKIKENLEAECLDSCLISALDNCKVVYEVDNSGDLEDAVREVIRTIKVRPKQIIGRYDYSEFVDKL